VRSLAAAVLLAALAVACHRGTEPSGSGRAEMQPAPDVSAESPNARIERQVRAQLYGDPQLTGGGSIVVVVDGGRVVLEGWVGSQTERTLAEADAATVAGVVAVDDRLVVRRTAAAPEAGR
jgi:osmotically-inducible protein OsmY